MKVVRMQLNPLLQQLVYLSLTGTIWPLNASEPQQQQKIQATSPDDQTVTVGAAAEVLLSKLSNAERSITVFKFNDEDQRLRWSNLPTGIFERKGLRMGDLKPAQFDAVMAVLKVTLSADGYQQVIDNMAGEETLNSGGRRGRLVFGKDEYYFSILGTPSVAEPWMWQFGGHHLAISLSFATADEADFAKWEKEIDTIEAKIKSGISAPGSIVFVGSSSIRKWKLADSFPSLKTCNHGFGGSQMADSVHFFERIVAPVKPAIIVVYAGDNDIAQEKSPETVAADFAQFCAKVKEQLPDCRKVVYVSIKPSVKRWGLADTIKAANRLIETQCQKDEQLHYLDVWTLMLDANGQPRPELLLKDGLHMTDDGYKIWNDALEPLLH